MPKKGIAIKRKKTERRRLLNEEEFNKLVETGKATESDQRSWTERRNAETAKRKKKKA